MLLINVHPGPNGISQLMLFKLGLTHFNVTGSALIQHYIERKKETNKERKKERQKEKV